MFCAQCGTVVSANSRFCVNCGSQITDPAAASAGTLALTQAGEAQLLTSVRRALAADYEVECEIGRGGMAVVFKARDTELDRPVALKVLPPELAPVATVADRFKREARLAAALDHPNVIPVYRVGQSGGVLYMAMKFIDGCALDTLVHRNGALPLPVVLTVLRASARAVAFAHDHGIIHRDLKPANILIDRDGRVVVSDFGIARAVEASTLTATGAMIGTPHFMSPEQCAGKGVGPQSDQYSLGIVAFVLLTGDVPFDGDSLPEILQHHWFTPPPDASLMRPDSPAALTATVLRLLAKDPAQRFVSTHDLVRALDAIPFGEAERSEGEAALRSMVAAAAGPVAASAAVPASSVPVTPAAPRIPTRPIDPPLALAATPTAAASAPTVRTPPPTAEQPPAVRAAPANVRAPKPKTVQAARRSHWTSHWVSKVIVGVAAVAVLALVGLGAARRRAALGAAIALDGSGANGRTFSVAELRRIGARAYRDGDYELARRFFVRATIAAPDDRYAQEDLGCALLKLDRPRDAERHFRLAGSATGQSSTGCYTPARP